MTTQLGITTVGELLRFSRDELQRQFGASTAEFLANLPWARDASHVKERGPQQSILAERSFPPITRCVQLGMGSVGAI